ncbi:MAG: hypothetical protein CM1200mP26_18960 [Acidimicrobiales bacterium]|nr:MAG: hypothetical protein CM1200mP26_18960 [Acidimicrobiales bacterium]
MEHFSKTDHQPRNESTMRNDAQCVIIGGGAMGVGLLYHLAHEGWTDTLLIEKGELTSGSTWHAAGLVPHFIGSLNMAKVHAYGAELYTKLEEETGLATGWHGCGAIRLAVNQEQAEWYRYVQAMLDSLDIESHLIGHDDIPHPGSPHGVHRRRSPRLPHAA